jgi:hypothetical protein
VILLIMLGIGIGVFCKDGYCWIWRNKNIHDASFIRPLQPVQFVMQRCREYRDSYKAQCIVSERPRSTVLIGWKPPVDG